MGVGERFVRLASQSIVTTGAALLGIAIAYHTRELLILKQIIGPAIALLLDGIPALGLVYAGYRLDRTSLSASELWRTVAWSLIGALLFMSVIGLTFLVLVVEGRRLAEPIFQILVTAEIGALAGVTAGYYHARARAETRRVATVNKAVGFVNDLIRHDLRNDLSVIRGQADLLNSSVSTTETGSAPGDPGVIEEKTEEALTRLETTRAITETLVRDPSFEPIDLSRITVELASQLDDVFPVTVTTRVPDNAYVRANVGIRSVVDNVLENAAQHNDADDPRIDVEIEQREDQVILRVSDNGPGIPAEEKSDVFGTDDDEFDAHGLALVHTLVDAYGGHISLEDNDPRGTVVIIQVPRASIHDDSPPD